jgi:hypothetical protein
MKGFLRATAIAMAMAMITLAGCVDTSVSATDGLKVSTAEQGLSTCSSSCDPPAYNGVPVSCSSNEFCFSDAGGVYCGYGGDLAASYCTEIMCPNGTCEPGENSDNCPADCPPPPPCGDGYCAPDEHDTCQADCCRPPDCYFY